MGHRTGLLTPPGEGLYTCLETVRGLVCLWPHTSSLLMRRKKEGSRW